MAVVLTIISIFVLYLIIRWAIDSSDLAYDIRTIREILEKQFPVDTVKAEEADIKDVAAGKCSIEDITTGECTSNSAEYVCPACGAGLADTDMECPECGLSLK